ncbi:MAG: PEGA domain-containing protein [Planctomycetota bacterium]
MTNRKWLRLVLIAVLLAIVTSFTIGGNGCNFLAKENNTNSSVTPAPAPAEEYSFGLAPLPRAQYDLIPMIAAPLGGVTGLPSSYDLSDKMPTPGNQYRQGSCVAWAVAYALKSYQEQDERNWGANTNAHRFSPAYIYNQINGGRDGGSFIPYAINILTEQGCATMATMPYHPNSWTDTNDYLTQPSQAARTEAANYKCIIYRTVNIMDRTEIKGFLYSGAPLVIAIQVGANLWYRDKIRDTNYIYRSLGDTIPLNEERTDWGYAGHAVTLVGYDNTKRAFKFINSWGTDWGDGGYAWIDYDFFPQVCFEAYWVQDYVATQSMGSLAVYSTPSSAGVYLNDVYKGTTPITLVDIPVGTYSLKISKTGYVTQNIAVTIVQGQAPDKNVTLEVQTLPAPTLMYPAYGSTTTDTTPDFDWSDIPTASAYGIMVDNNFDFSSPEISQTTTPSNYTPTTPLTTGTYYWKVRTQDSSSAWGNWSTTWSFTINQPVPTPAQVTSPNPANGASGVITTTQLAWASAARATSYDVYFGISSPPPKVVTDTTNTSYNPGTLDSDTTYYWRIDSKNSYGTTQGAVWSFITTNQPITPPDQVTSPNPLDGTTNLPITQQLSWSAANGATSYNVYFDTANPPTAFRINTAATGYDPNTLPNDTITYYWRIDSKNSAGTTTQGTVWNFQTVYTPPPPPLPDQVSLSSPSDGATSVSLSASLSWATAGNATSYDVYFGTSYPPAYQVNTTDTSYSPSMANYTDYYWRIVSRNETGTTDGDVWSFKTAGTATFNYTGSPETWTVPDGVYEINVDVRGAQGGAGYYGTAGGKGARVQTMCSVTPGETLYIYVGGQGIAGTVAGGGTGGTGWPGGGNGGNDLGGGGGGGASAIGLSAPPSSSRFVIAGGGGGGGGTYSGFSAGKGGTGGEYGSKGGDGALYSGLAAGGGWAGTSSGGGAGGVGAGSSHTAGTSGSSSGGGTGGGGGSTGGGGGGGGRYGGGGGGGSSWGGGGGGGGSSFGQTGATFTDGNRSGNGYIKITY